jgi:hypothetical protein
MYSTLELVSLCQYTFSTQYECVLELLNKYDIIHVHQTVKTAEAAILHTRRIANVKHYKSYLAEVSEF